MNIVLLLQVVYVIFHFINFKSDYKEIGFLHKSINKNINY